jgi:hypothetical protein
VFVDAAFPRRRRWRDYSSGGGDAPARAQMPRGYLGSALPGMCRVAGAIRCAARIVRRGSGSEGRLPSRRSSASPPTLGPEARSPRRQPSVPLICPIGPVAQGRSSMAPPARPTIPSGRLADGAGRDRCLLQSGSGAAQRPSHKGHASRAEGQPDVARSKASEDTGAFMGAVRILTCDRRVQL